MPPALPVVRVQSASRNAGKTWLASALIAELTTRGYRVGAVKHSHHPVPADKPSSDTELFARAGAERVIFATAGGWLERTAGETTLALAIERLAGEVDIAVVEGFASDPLGARLVVDSGSQRAMLLSMEGRTIVAAPRDDVTTFASAIECAFELAPGGSEELRHLIRRAGVAHGHLCPGVTLGVRMALAALRQLDLPLPVPHRCLDVTVETARCATDAIAVVTGCSLGRGNLRVEERGAMAARVLDLRTGCAVRVAARDEAKALARRWAPGAVSTRHAQAIAYRAMPDELLLDVGACGSGAEPA